LDEFIRLLRENGVTHLVDVRTVPRSRHNPQYNRETLPDELSAAGISYTHMPNLGGLRKPRPDSPNTAWRNASFQGYADYMQTPQFEEALQTLIELARRDRIAVMCAEAVPWRCHRSLIADALLVRGFPVEDIMGEGKTQKHKLTPWAHIEGTHITYPAPVETEPVDS
jgi:uncharacterized protein (DUF488 family)